MKKILILIFLLGTFGVSEMIAQERWQQGYILTLEGDTVRGQLLAQSVFANYKKAVFKREGFVNSYFPYDIIGFGYENGGLFEHLPGMETFVKVMVSGYLSLYKQDNRYYFKKGEEVGIVAQVGGGIGRFLEAVSVHLILEDCLQLEESFVGQLSDSQLIEKVVAYNQCQNSPYRVYSDESPVIDVEFGLKGTLILGQIVTDEVDEPRGIMPDSYQAWDVSGGVSMWLEFPRLSENFFAETGVYHNKQRFVGIEEDEFFNQIAYHETQIDLRYLQFPLLVGYQSSAYPSKFRFKGGASFLQPLATSFVKTTDIDFGNFVSQGQPAEVWEFEPFFIGLHAGVAYRYEMGRFALGVEGMYTRTLELESNTLYSIQLQMFSTSIQLIWL